MYKGLRRSGEHTYVLLPDQDGEGFILEKLDYSYNFNLTKTPTESSTQVLAQRYDQLSYGHEEGEDGDPSGDSLDREADAESDNPFDYRHYLNVADSPSPPVQPVRGSAIGTPASMASQMSSRANTPLAKSVKKKTPSAFALQERKAAAKAKAQAKPAQHKRARLSPDAERREERADIPTVRLDRRASTRVAPSAKKTESRQQRSRNDNDADELSLETGGDDDDGGDLILEGDTNTTSSNYRNQRSLGAALSGTLGGGRGPRSLQSAASSPASHVDSPHSVPNRNHDQARNTYDRHVDTDGEDIEIDMGPDSPEEKSPEPEDMELQLEDAGYADEDADAESDGDLVMDDVDVDADADADGDADVDVDEMHLPSPAQVHRPSISNTVVTVDEDDDLENQMLAALEGGNDAESEEESEEE